MEEVFNKLKSGNGNVVDGVVNMFKQAKVVDGKSITEDSIRKQFQNLDPGKIDFNVFKNAISNIAGEAKMNVEELSKRLSTSIETVSAGAGTLLGAMQAGASAFKDAINKKTD